MRNKLKKVITVLFIMAMVVSSSTYSCVEAQAATKKKWITNKKYAKLYYLDHDNTKTAPDIDNGEPAYSLSIKKITKKGKITFQIEYSGKNWSPIISSNTIKGKIKGNKVKFKWKDSWGCSGTGTLKFNKNGTLRLKMIEKKHNDSARGTLATSNGKYATMRKWK